MGDHKGKRVAVIGGGPGGAQCARRLAEAGVDVTVFEPRVRFEKACGGGIPARGLERYPFLLDTGLAGKAVRECLVVAPSGRIRNTVPQPNRVILVKVAPSRVPQLGSRGNRIHEVRGKHHA